ncbi:prepilin-type N-terminal cleavage/methylation domain-containing protein [Candidatus Gracilibacteria bacterium]|nr:prepilin-type N-terminal cleavage/methylation domain-containing protein [Candidatus Gracilibacteria bacterium]
MKLQRIKSGFTLIELLVVITIIGILATGAVSIYTSQIQKARDSTRITSINALKASVEQVYQDASTYPLATSFITQVSVYMENFPKDPKHGQPCNSFGGGTVDCGFAYVTGNDANGILYGTYELSTAFENTGNVTARAATDSGTDNLRLEIGINTSGRDTAVAQDAITEQVGACTTAGNLAAAATDLIIINGNPGANPVCG